MQGPAVIMRKKGEQGKGNHVWIRLQMWKAAFLPLLWLTIPIKTIPLQVEPSNL